MRGPHPPPQNNKRHVPFLHQAADLCLGHRHPDHAGRRARDHAAADRAISADRADRGHDHGDLSRRQRRDGGELGDQGHRAEHDRSRLSPVHVVVEHLDRPGADLADLHQRGRCRHRPGAGAEQAAARDALAAAGRAAAGHQGREVVGELPDGARLRLRGRKAGRQRHRRLRGILRQRSHQPRRGRRPGDVVRRRIRHAHLARPRQAGEIQSDARRRDRRDPDPEYASDGRPARRPAGGRRPAAQCHHHLAEPPADGRAVQGHHSAHRDIRPDGAHRRRRARRDRLEVV